MVFELPDFLFPSRNEPCANSEAITQHVAESTLCTSSQIKGAMLDDQGEAGDQAVVHATAARQDPSCTISGFNLLWLIVYASHKARGISCANRGLVI